MRLNSIYINFTPRLGAFNAVHGAQMYPDIKGVFLDATFDDVALLAEKAMPQSFSN